MPRARQPRGRRRENGRARRWGSWTCGAVREVGPARSCGWAVGRCARRGRASSREHGRKTTHGGGWRRDCEGGSSESHSSPGIIAARMTETATPKPRAFHPLVIGAVTGAVYAILMRGVAGREPIESVMTVAFLFVVPIVLGYLTVRPHPKPSWPYRLFAPWLPAGASLAAFFVMGWEGFLCILMSLPLTLPFASLGGILGALPALRRPRGRLVAAVVPFALAPLEHGIPVEHRAHRLESEIAIRAPAAAVWQEIVEVPTITEAEQRPALFTRLGLPRPVSATVDRHGTGGVRRARFERGVLFLETVTHWVPGQRLRFTIAAQTDSIPPETLDRHVTIGGPYFDVLVGEYTIESLPGGEVILHLASELRVTTHFNFYARLWVDPIMLSIQENILEVIRERAERRVSSAPTGAGLPRARPARRG